MTFEELKKKLKQAQNIKILFQELENNEFIATIKGIINSMEKKQKEPTIKEMLKEMQSNILNINNRLDNIEKDISDLKTKVNNIDDRLAIIEREATKHGWDLNHDNNF